MMGKETAAYSLIRETKSYPEVETDVSTHAEEEKPVLNERRPNGSLRERMVGELLSFEQALKEADMLRVQDEQECVVLEPERLKAEQEEREKDVCVSESKRRRPKSLVRGS